MEDIQDSFFFIIHQFETHFDFVLIVTILFISFLFILNITLSALTLAYVRCIYNLSTIPLPKGSSVKTNNSDSTKSLSIEEIEKDSSTESNF